MKRFGIVAACLAATGALAGALAPANATVYDFTISTSQDTASGQFTTTGNTVSSVTGTVDGAAIIGLSGYGGADQHLNATSPYVDRAGVAFETASLAFNIFENYSNNGTPVYSFCNSAFNGSCTGGDANAAPIAVFTLKGASAVPESATWAMMMLGVGAVGSMMRRVHRKSEDSFTAKVREIAAA